MEKIYSNEPIFKLKISMRYYVLFSVSFYVIAIALLLAFLSGLIHGPIGPLLLLCLVCVIGGTLLALIFSFQYVKIFKDKIVLSDIWRLKRYTIGYSQIRLIAYEVDVRDQDGKKVSGFPQMGVFLKDSNLTPILLEPKFYNKNDIRKAFQILEGISKENRFTVKCRI